MCVVRLLVNLLIGLRFEIGDVWWWGVWLVMLGRLFPGIWLFLLLCFTTYP